MKLTSFKTFKWPAAWRQLVLNKSKKKTYKVLYKKASVLLFLALLLYIFWGVALYKAKMYMTSTKLNQNKAAMYVSPSIPVGVKFFIV